MMFVESKERIVHGYPVDIQRVADGGKTVTERVLVDFKLLGRKARDAIPGGDAGLLRAVIVHLTPIKLRNDEVVEFSPEILEQILDDDAACIALYQAYAVAITGGARRKN